MRRWLLILALLALAVPLIVAGCTGCGDDDDDDDDDDDTQGDVPDARFQEICGERDWQDTLLPIELAYDSGKDFGDMGRLGWTVAAGDYSTVHFIAEHPIWVKTLRLHFTGQGGPVRIHVFGDFGRSTPDVDNELIDPVEEDVADDAGWVEFDITDQLLTLLPSEHFWVTYEHLAEEPYLSTDNGVNTDTTHSLWRIEAAQYDISPFEWAGFSDVAFMARVEGDYFCELEQRQFTEVSEAAGLAGKPAVRINWGDVNDDGWDDIMFHIISYQADTVTLLLNEQDGTFKDVTDDSGLNGHYSSFGLLGDVDNDGNLDAYLGVNVPNEDSTTPDSGARSTILLGNGDGTFDEVTGHGVGLEATTAAGSMADYDNDGNLDMYVGNWLLKYPMPASFADFIFQGKGNGKFEETSDDTGIAGMEARPCYGVTWVDFDMDGDMDVSVANYGRVDNYLLENRSGRFFDVAPQVGLDRQGVGTGGNTFGTDWGDIDNDGNFDTYQAEIAHPRYQPSSDIGSLMHSQGEDEDWLFENVTEDLGIAYDEGQVDPSFVDFNNDGRLDFAISVLYTLQYFRLYRQEADGTFVDVTYLTGTSTLDANNNAWADFDRDGDMDLMSMDRISGGSAHLFRNDVGNQLNWLEISLRGTDSNRLAVGTRVVIESALGKQVRYVQAGKGHAGSQHSARLHFGLNADDVVQTVTVYWPSGLEQEFVEVPVNQIIKLKEGDDNYSVEE